MVDNGISRERERTNMNAPLEVFCCYAREDHLMLKSLKKHLALLQREGQIIIRSDTDLNAGVEWERELHQYLEKADIILLLISPDFMSSDYCYSSEMKRAMARHEQNSAHVIPILLRSVLWQNAPFATLQVVPTNARPVKSWSDEDDAFHNVAEQISRVVFERHIQFAQIEANDYARAERYQEALTCYEQILGKDQQNGVALFGKARMLYQLGQLDDSISAFTRAAQIAPTSQDVISLLSLADALKQRERYAESLAVNDQARNLDPGNASIHFVRAMILIEQQAYEQALNALEQALKLDQERIEYVTQTGELLFRLQRFAEALVMYEQASKLQPGEASHYEKQGKILLQLERYGDALVAIQHALTISPEMRYYEQAGKICLHLALYVEALEIYEQAIQRIQEDNPYFQAGKGQALLQLERYDEALACYQTAIKLSEPETDPRFYYDLGTLYERLTWRSHSLERTRRLAWKDEGDHSLFLRPVFTSRKPPLLHTFDAHQRSVSCVAFSPNHKLLASGGYDQTIRLWELRTRRELTTFAGHTNSIESITFSPDGKLLASGSTDTTIRVWDLASGQKLGKLTGHTDAIHSITFSPDGKLLASGSADTTIRVWEPSSGQELGKLTGHTDAIRSITFSPDGKLLASGGTDTTIRVWDLASGLTRIFNGTGFLSIAISPDGTFLVGGGTDIRLWELPTGREVGKIIGHTNFVTSVTFSHDSKFLASGSFDHTIRLWELPSRRELCRLTDHDNTVWCVTTSPNDKLLASGSFDHTLKLWRIQR
jgi:tetratricopeptide (TPR) repeat protein